MDSGPLIEPLPPTRAAASESPYAVLRHRDFSLYLIARFIAALGQQMLTVAVGWELYERTHLSLALGMVGLTQMVPMVLFFLPAGHVADHYNRKRTILAMVFLATLSSTGLALISALHGPVLWIYGCLLAAGVARTFLWPASQAFLPQLVPRRIFSRAVTWNTGAFHLSSVIGPAVGSVISAIYLAHRPPLQRAGRALVWAVIAFGIATIAFGLSRWFWLSFAMLFICGAVDNVSVVVRHTLVQLLTPDEMRGRVSAVNSLFIGTSNELGGFESGLVAQLFGPVVSVVAGGVGTILVVIATALNWPEIRKYGRLDGSA